MEDNDISASSKIIPIDNATAEEIGREALEKIGYHEIIKLSEKAGFVEYKSDVSVQLASYESVVATGFVPVFSRYAVAGAVTSQADSPLPGPADIAAVGVIVIGLVDAGLLDGSLLHTVGAWLAGMSSKPLLAKAKTNEAKGTVGTTEAAGSGTAEGDTTTKSTGTAHAIGTEAGVPAATAGASTVGESAIGAAAFHMVTCPAHRLRSVSRTEIGVARWG